MVWARACKIGCALVQCSNSELMTIGGSSKSNTYLLVCAYGPRFQNALPSNSRPYQRGGTYCQHCPNGFQECGDIYRPTYSSPPTGFRATEPITNLCCKCSFCIALFNPWCISLDSCWLQILLMEQRLALAQTHILPSDYLEEICSATLSRVNSTPPLISSAMTNW